MKINVTNTFLKAIKKMHQNQINYIEDAIEMISSDPEIGESKKGDLAGVRVYKFRVQHQLILIAYTSLKEKNASELTLLSIGTHENFYKNLKRHDHAS